MTRVSPGLNCATFVIVLASAGVGQTQAVVNIDATERVARSTHAFVGDSQATLPSTPSDPSISLPGTFEAEDFDHGGAEVGYHDDSIGNSGGAYRATDVDLEPTADIGGGYNVGWASAGEWLAYTVNVTTTGIFTFEIRVACLGPGGSFHIEADGVDKTGPITVPNTGNWQSWTTLSHPGVALMSGPHVLRLVMDTIGNNGATGNFNWIRVTSSSGGSMPYRGSPVPLPGTIEAEDFDEGGADVAYRDESPGNSGGAYRATDVDLEPTTDTGDGYNVGWANAGEWLKYTVNVAATGTYTMEVRLASAGAGGIFHVEANGVDKTGPIVVTNTGGWQEWKTTIRRGISLAAGTQVLRVVMDTIGSGAVGNFNWLRFTPEPSRASAPYSSTPAVLPGRIEAENFDSGGAEAAYHDTSPGNSGGAYRETDVDIQPTTDEGGGHNVGWTAASEWLKYTVNVATTGTYAIEVRVASDGPGGTFHVETNGVDKTGPLHVPDTGGWQAWTTVTYTGVPLAIGTETLRLVFDTTGPSGATGNVNWIQFQLQQGQPLSIVAPEPGARLRTTAVTFRWSAGGDDSVLTVGSTPGGANVYDSGSLGPASEHTVPRVPLDGRLLYVQLRRTNGGIVDRADALFVAPVRKGLAIIADFSNRRLEDWAGAGMKSVNDVSAQLRELEAHWAWLSLGQEKFQWDITRIQLAQAAVPGAFSSWWQFRETIATLVKQQVDVRDYDLNRDGVLDISWVIVSSGDGPIEYAIGGASMNGSVNMFMDGQASQSVAFKHTGNFTHEVGHLLGIQDMYGPYGTLSTLTLMSYSWPLPPPGFSAYEKLSLGWLTPQIVADTARDLWLPIAEESPAAVKVPTARGSEYFLIEYRKRPSTGYGSDDVAYDGLAIYHVLEGSSMGQNPPIVKLEPADGSIQPSQPLDVHDLASPENPLLLRPMAVYSYFGDGQEAFRLENVSRRGNGISFDLVIAAGAQPGENMLVNSSFENGAGVLEAWRPTSWVWMPDAFIWPSPVARSGERSAHVNASSVNDASWIQTVNTLVPGQSYELCGWVKGENIAGADVGANVSLLGGFVRSASLLGTFDWTKQCVIFVAEATRVDVACRLGFYGSVVSGKLWCDDLSLVRLVKPF